MMQANFDALLVPICIVAVPASGGDETAAAATETGTVAVESEDRMVGGAAAVEEMVAPSTGTPFEEHSSAWDRVVVGGGSVVIAMVLLLDCSECEHGSTLSPNLIPAGCSSSFIN